MGVSDELRDDFAGTEKAEASEQASPATSG